MMMMMTMHAVTLLDNIEDLILTNLSIDVMRYIV